MTVKCPSTSVERKYGNVTLVVLGIVIVGACCASLARAELHTGTARIPIGLAWDFSDSLASKEGDIYQAVARRTANSESKFPYFLKGVYPALLAYSPGDSTFMELQTAPADTTLYHDALNLFVGMVCVVRTRELHYAKCQVLNDSDQWVDIEYAYQDDGSRILVAPVASQQTTWGRLKNLFRRR